MTAWLPDVNVLIALLDPDHVHHDRAHAWFSSIGSAQWLSCPITQNAVLRIMAHPGYPNTQPLALVRDSLRSLLASEHHSFVADSISLLSDDDATAHQWLPDMLSTSGMVTDTYLIVLARAHMAQLATFDRKLEKAPVVAGAPPVQLIP